jgi:hypothetical protein
VCPIVFDRNSHDTNVLVRIADIMWGSAGLSNNLPWATVHIPTSVYSLPLILAEEVGGWDGDPTAIGEGELALASISGNLKIAQHGLALFNMSCSLQC